MSELSPEARSLLDATRHADNPAASDRERMRRRLAAQLGGLVVARQVTGRACPTLRGRDRLRGSSRGRGAPWRPTRCSRTLVGLGDGLIPDGTASYHRHRARGGRGQGVWIKGGVAPRELRR